MLEWLLYIVVVWFRRAYPLPTRSLRSLVEEGVLPSNLDKNRYAEFNQIYFASNKLITGCSPAQYVCFSLA